MIRALLTAIGQTIADLFRPREERGFDTHQPPMKPRPLIALLVGHSRLINGRPEGGAVSTGRVSEWAYNREIARLTAEILESRGYRVEVIDRYEGAGYAAAMSWVASRLKSIGATVAVELHFNAAGPTARGHEWLFWHASTQGQRLAVEFDKAFREMFPEIPRRGAKPRMSADRGAEFLRLTHCPALIAEPFFGSNAADWKVAVERKTDIANAYARALSAYLSAL